MAVATGARSAKGTVEKVELTKPEQTAARRAAESKATVPHLYLEAEVEIAAGQPIGPVVVGACAAALRATPRLNGAYHDGKLDLYSRVNIAVAIPDSTRQAPTIFDADRKSTEEIAGEIEALAARAAEGSITAPELSGATFTVEDLSQSAAAGVTGTITPGQSALVTIGAPATRPAIIGGELAERTVVRIGLACDHRVVGASEAAAFLGEVKSALGRSAAD